MKYVWITVAIAAIVALVLWVRGGESTPQPAVTNFEECVAAGNLVIETNPEQCQTADGKLFVKASLSGEVKEEEKTPIKNENKKTTINGMTIETIKEGTGVEIKNGQTAVVQYEGKLTDGTVFDSTAKRNNTPFEFPLGAGMVIKGWDQGVLGMKIGETRKLTIPSELAYGERGAGGLIPPNATLIFTVTLEGIK